MLSIIIPTYNEKENLEKLVKRIFKVCTYETIGTETNIIVVDDNSPDGTGNLAESLKEYYPNKIHVLHRTEKGRGTAGIAGFSYALLLGADYIMEMDADFSHKPEDIPRFIKEIKNYDIVIGSRFVEDGAMPNRSFFRDFLTDIVNLYLKLLLHTNIKDMSGGFKCYKRKVLESLDFNNFVSTGYSIGAETLYTAHKKGFSMKEIPIIFNERTAGISKCSLKIMLDYVIKILQIKIRYG